MTAPDVFRRVVRTLEAAGIPYMLTGSFASAYHGVPRATQDIDLVIAPSREQLRDLARARGGEEFYLTLTVIVPDEPIAPVPFFSVTVSFTLREPALAYW